MNETKYYQEIENIIQNIEVNSKVRALQDNNEKLKGYWKIGKLLVEAQGGEKRAKYGNSLIKKWSSQLKYSFGNFYGITNLKNMRQFYLIFQKGRAVSDQLTWTHYRYLLPIKNENERNYYINQVILNNLSSRELISLIKSKTFERLSYIDKENIQLIEGNNYTLTIKDMIKDPIIIEIKEAKDRLEEVALHKYIIEMLENKFLELGTGFSLLGHEYKLNINGTTYKIDLLFFNIELNCYVVVEIKTKGLHSKDIGQLDFYVNYVNLNIKKSYHSKTIGLLVVKKNNKYIIEYTTSKDIYVTTYQLVQ